MAANHSATMMHGAISKNEGNLPPACCLDLARLARMLLVMVLGPAVPAQKHPMGNALHHGIAPSAHTA